MEKRFSWKPQRNKTYGEKLKIKDERWRVGDFFSKWRSSGVYLLEKGLKISGRSFSIEKRFSWKPQRNITYREPLKIKDERWRVGNFYRAEDLPESLFAWQGSWNIRKTFFYRKTIQLETTTQYNVQRNIENPIWTLAGRWFFPETKIFRRLYLLEKGLEITGRPFSIEKTVPLVTTMQYNVQRNIENQRWTLASRWFFSRNEDLPKSLFAWKKS